LIFDIGLGRVELGSMRGEHCVGQDDLSSSTDVAQKDPRFFSDHDKLVQLLGKHSHMHPAALKAWPMKGPGYTSVCQKVLSDAKDADKRTIPELGVSPRPVRLAQVLDRTVVYIDIRRRILVSLTIIWPWGVPGGRRLISAMSAASLSRGKLGGLHTWCFLSNVTVLIVRNFDKIVAEQRCNVGQ
jgi:hypothetical protein